jgi:hypothetical protein
MAAEEVHETTTLAATLITTTGLGSIAAACWCSVATGVATTRSITTTAVATRVQAQDMVQ